MVLTIENLKFAYDEESSLIDIPYFELKKSERVFLYGPSGSGKTTLLSLVTGILSAKEGKISILGQNLSSLTRFRRDRLRARSMGYIFQQFNLIPYLSVQENIEITGWLSKERQKRSFQGEAKKWAESLGIADCFHRKALELSVGQQQRVAVARALFGRPEIVIADEPTSALDEDRQNEFLEIFLKNAKDSEAAVIFVSHNQRLATSFDRKISLSEINSRNGS